MGEPAHERDAYLYTPVSYRGEFSPEGLIFNANLQEFARRVGFVCDLETSGKITAEAAYLRIRELWDTFESSGRSLGIGGEDLPPPA